MPISRRGFLRGLLATATTVVVAPIVAPIIVDPDYERWTRGEGRIWAPKWEPVDPRQRIISECLKTAEGRARLAESMTRPLKTRRDYVSIGRKTFSVEPLSGDFRSTPEALAAREAWRTCSTSC